MLICCAHSSLLYVLATVQWRDVKTVLNECVSRMSSSGIYTAPKLVPLVRYTIFANLKNDGQNFVGTIAKSGRFVFNLAGANFWAMQYARTH